MTKIRALIAEDEPILALTLANMLTKLWPELDICASVENGVAALQETLALQPDVLFLDIKMPGKTGLEVAQELAEEWLENRPFPLIVYVTAYDEFALQAFEHAAADYVLKPINAERLGKSIKRLQAKLGDQQERPNELESMLAQLRHLLPAAASANASAGSPAPANGERLTLIRAAIGNQIRMIPIADVLYFEATDKYINVVTAEHSSLIRMSLRELLPQLDSSIFWQIHRGSIVNSNYILSAMRDEAGKLTLKLRGSADKLPVSRVYAHLFKQM
ncbi:LytR/AlgR family response regulator transcription factor [Undibacterium parvum]|uniref:Response regulator transcription factor n=1 Tax=Undibacterium parvum TaxID=401471 RepID=A0A3Q9BS22_9BURK|nr:LytTR family DNA-binding domain-containing protein [Undibacterium parvum]AZP13235.1 response regulator transcription factor [Undibacterium parvum]